MQAERNRYAHTQDAHYRECVQKAIRQLEAALSATAIEHYAAEKLHNASTWIDCARDRFDHLHPGVREL
jgi:hypothetical protein